MRTVRVTATAKRSGWTVLGDGGGSTASSTLLTALPRSRCSPHAQRADGKPAPTAAPSGWTLIREVGASPSDSYSPLTDWSGSETPSPAGSPVPADVERGQAAGHQDLYKQLGIWGPVDVEAGLSEKQVAASRARHGRNKLPTERPTPCCVYLARQYVQPRIVILLLLLALTMYQVFSVKVKNAERVGEGKRPLPVGAEHWVKMGTLMFVVVLVTTFNAVAHSRTGAALGKLAALAGDRPAIVRREGLRQEVPQGDVVVGDVVLVEVGGTVPADLRLIQVDDASCVEAALTGDPAEIKKTVVPMDLHAPFRSNMMYSSSLVVSGKAIGICTAVGEETEVGKIAHKLDVAGEVMSPLDRTMGRLGSGLVVIVVAMLVIFAIVIYITEQYDLAKFNGNRLLAVLVEAFSLASICLPTTLTLAVSVNMQKGALSLKTRSARLKDFTVVETLGCTDVICADKTGTLTEGRMTAVACATLTEQAGPPKPMLLGFYPTRGFDPAGGLFRACDLQECEKQMRKCLGPGERLDAAASAKLLSLGLLNYGDKATADSGDPLPRALVGAAFLNCDASAAITKSREGTYECAGSASEAALVVAGAKVGMWRAGAADLGDPPEDVHGKHPEVPSLAVPFTPQRMMKLTVHAVAEGRLFAVPLPPEATHVAVVKGAPDVVAPHVCQLYARDLKRISPLGREGRDELSNLNHGLASQGLHVLAVALRPLTEADMAALRSIPDGDARLAWVKGNGLVFLGLIGLEDPPREGVRESVRQCHECGIKVVMITGDQASTAASVSGKIGIIRKGERRQSMWRECKVLHKDPRDPTGSAFHTDHVNERKVAKPAVWARAQPIDKVTIVESMQRQGQVVAMMGDGVNDAAALRAADIGTAMGIAGTDVAKSAADMVLLDDNFSTIVEAVRAGRRIYGNLQKYVYYYLGLKICELLMFTLCVFLRWPKPVGAVRALLGINITHDATPVTLSFEKPERHQMRAAPRRAHEPILTRLLVVCRLIPQVIYYNAFVLGSTLLLAKLYVGSVCVNLSADNYYSWMGGDGMCLKAWQCDFGAGGMTGCHAQLNPFICRSPLDRSLYTRREWYYEYGSVDDVFSIGDDPRALDGFEQTGMLQNGHHQAATAKRRWVAEAEYTQFYYAKENASVFLAATLCDPRKGKFFVDESPEWREGPGDYNEICWTEAAVRLFGQDADEYPQIAGNANRADWSMRMLHGATFLTFVMTELGILWSCRSEQCLWKAPRNVYCYVCSAVVFALALLLVFTPIARSLDMAPVDGLGWQFMCASVVGTMACSEMFKAVYKKQLAMVHEHDKARNVYMNPVGYTLPDSDDSSDELCEDIGCAGESD